MEWYRWGREGRGTERCVLAEVALSYNELVANN